MLRANLSLVGLVVGLAAARAAAETPADLLRRYAAAARSEGPDAPAFSAARGEQFFRSTHGGAWSCATCHTQAPAAPGSHTVTRKPIAPLAPAANPERFTNFLKAEKWFDRNCSDVLQRPCTAHEKGDVLTYLLSLGR